MIKVVIKLINRLRNWINVNYEYKSKTIIEYPNREKLAKLSFVFAIAFLVSMFIISAVSPRETIPKVIETYRETHPLLEPYQTLVYVCVWLFVIFAIIAVVFFWKMDKTISKEKT